MARGKVQRMPRRVRSKLQKPPSILPLAKGETWQASNMQGLSARSAVSGRRGIAFRLFLIASEESQVID